MKDFITRWPDAKRQNNAPRSHETAEASRTPGRCSANMNPPERAESGRYEKRRDSLQLGAGEGSGRASCVQGTLGLTGIFTLSSRIKMN